MRRLIVCAPLSTGKGGGIEALYQLADAIHSHGASVAMAEPEGDGRSPVPEDYAHYHAPRLAWKDVSPEDWLVVPEIWITHPLWIDRPRVVVWWLSVDNAFEGCNGFEPIAKPDLLQSPRYLIGACRRLPVALWRRHTLMHTLMRTLTRRTQVIHAAQSHYAKEFVARYGLRAVMLTDYIDRCFFAERYVELGTPEQIAFNPRKGGSIVQVLSSRLPELKFMPLAGFERFALAAALRHSAIYLDLGHHPGRDRIPREAAASGCIVIVGRAGAAANNVDVPLPLDYKVQLPRTRHGIDRIVYTLKRILLNPSIHFAAQRPYREVISRQRTQFQSEVRALLAVVRSREDMIHGAAPEV